MQNDDITSTASNINKDTGPALTVKEILRPLYESLTWIRLFSACLIFYSALITITGIGILFAWVPMWIGVILILFSRSISAAYKDDDEAAMKHAFSRLKFVFTILGYSSIVLIVASIYLVKYAFDKSLF